jgi:PhzF family phenazine biosynthesis protein
VKNNFFMVDAFTGESFRGNTAGVILTSFQLPLEKMQMIATQNNLPATAFLHVVNGTINLRWLLQKKKFRSADTRPLRRPTFYFLKK